MKTTSLILTALATGFVVADVKKEDYFPECSIECLDEGTEKATDCSKSDAVCWCVQSNYEAIYNQAVNCVMEECGPDKAIESVLPAAIEFCSAASSSTSALGGAATGKSKDGDASKTDTSAPATITPGPDSTPSAVASTSISASASASASDLGDAVSTTASTDGAVAIGPLGAFGLLLLGVAAVL
ncbi:hypothetical protein AK830_g8542 [Neonectria ditissima]|uniref:CFEM domain-containing protein n=1 Tax=Neonectria ditissima TaxID=78410 RepID=A0A0P7AX79_9HYPO|nr:hypothetical protein AK830_g8542 [Neonectria ditissima]